jgi:chromate transporter
VAATAGVILPSLVVITLIAAFFASFQDYAIVKAAFMGIRPAVVALIITAVLKVGRASIKDRLGYVIVLAACTAVMLFDVHVIFVIICGAAAGLLIYMFFPGKVKKITSKEEEEK